MIRPRSQALAALGYRRAADVIAAIRGWHHGRYPAIRTARARELLTEMQPILIEALAKTANPDLAFIGFDRFLSELPSGVQLFSLLKQNPSLIHLIAQIMGSRRAWRVSWASDAAFWTRCWRPASLATCPAARNWPASLPPSCERRETSRTSSIAPGSIANEQAFLIGVRVLTGSIGASQAGGAYAQLAECMIEAMQELVEREMARAHG